MSDADAEERHAGDVRNAVESARARETERIHAAYADRANHPTDVFNEQARAERYKHYDRMLENARPGGRSGIRLLEVGCGNGSELAQLIQMGVQPECCTGIELLPDRYENAKRILPPACDIRLGDACETNLESGDFDVVFASTVFTSVLDDDVQAALAKEMWRLVGPGGAVLWYDFVYNNPRNPDVRGVPRSRVLELFPQAAAKFRRVTLAPPIGRRLNWLGPIGYRVFNTIPFLRTHLVGWLRKSE